MKKRLIAAVAVLAAGGVAWYVLASGGASEFTYRTEAISRGEIEKVVRATGTINPLQTVKVGSQVSGTISRLFVDFNSMVTKGQIVAVIDSTFLSASVREAEANLQRATAQHNESERALSRMKELFSKALVSQADLDAALTAYETSLAQVRQTEAALERARVNLRYAVIRSPIDGIVISRDVDVGQTVAASLSAPQLFAIANDLSRMQVEASVDEADIGQIAAGQTATFTVDAHPEEEFEGTVSQVRLSPITVQNVVTYTVIIEVPNPDNKLRPGMTATASILIDRRDEVLRVPAVALRFQPPAEALAEYQERAAADSAKPARGEGPPAAAADAGAARAAQGEGEGRRGRRPEGAADSAGAERRWNRQPMGGAGGGGQESGAWAGRRMNGRRRGQMAAVWILGSDGKISKAAVRTGLADQRYIELTGGDLKEGDRVILGVNAGDRAAGQRSTNPLQPQQMGGGRRGP